jgi:hypothetical protein
MTHLTRDELLRWRDAHDGADRGRIVAHLAECDGCGAMYAELIRTRPATEGPIALDARDFIAAGMAAGPQAVPRRSWWRAPAVWIAIPATAAAALVLMTLINRPSIPPLSEPTSTTRGSAVVPQSPTGPVTGRIEFRWTSPFAAARYRIVVRDASGVAVLSRETTGERLVADDATMRALPRGAYAWSVEALDAAGRTIDTSRPQAFELR